MFEENKHPRDKDGKFTDGSGQTNKTVEAIRKYSDDPKRDIAEYDNMPSANRLADTVPKNKMTPEEKIASVHIDFSKDNILPELNESELKKMGVTQNKPVLLKGDVIKRNLQRHIDVSTEIMQDIITETLYNPVDVFPANPRKPNYYHFASFVEIKKLDGIKIGLVLLDIDETKDNFEIGHAYFVGSDGFERAINKIKKD